MRTERFAGRPYVVAELDGPLEPSFRCSPASRAFELFELLEGPLLRPLDPDFLPHVPVEMAEARRYKGKTSDVFSHVLLNLALFAGAFAERCTDALRVLDPLCGGGTTSSSRSPTATTRSGSTQRADVESTAALRRGLLQGGADPLQRGQGAHRRGGPRWRFEAGPRTTSACSRSWRATRARRPAHLHGVPGGARVHAIAGDLPYGIQHDGEVTALLREALPAWAELLLPGGAVALAWNATRLARARVTELVAAAGLEVRDDGPYAELAHQVDRVIKQRDVVVAVRPETRCSSPDDKPERPCYPANTAFRAVPKWARLRPFFLR